MTLPVGVCIPLVGYYWIFCWYVTRYGIAAPSLDIQVVYSGSGYGSTVVHCALYVLLVISHFDCVH